MWGGKGKEKGGCITISASNNDNLLRSTFYSPYHGTYCLNITRCDVVSTIKHNKWFI